MPATTEFFNRKADAPSGLHARCKQCVRDYHKQWRKSPSGAASTRKTYEKKGTLPRPAISALACARCKVEKPATAEFFYRNAKNATGWGSYCKGCHKPLAKAWKRSHRYKITPDEFHSLTQKHQSCAICKLPFNGSPQVDHCHVTGKVRGLLCYKCNTLLGHADDSPEILESAIRYLKEHGN
jgi:hypothetical protein